MGIEIVYPQSIVNLPEPQKEEVLQIIYKRISLMKYLMPISLWVVSDRWSDVSFN